MDFGALPPEINSGRMYCGPGSGPMLAAAAAWDGVAVELGLAATGYASVIAELTGAPWVGAASLSMVAAATPYVAWLSQAAARAEQAGMQAAAAAAAYEAAFVMTVPPPVITANRVLVMTLIATNFFGQNSAAIAVAEAQYAEMWAQDAVAMYGYAAASASASRLIPFAAPPKTTNSAGVVAQAVASVSWPNPNDWWLVRLLGSITPTERTTIVRLLGQSYLATGMARFLTSIAQQLTFGPGGTTAGSGGAWYPTPQFAGLGAGPAVSASLARALDYPHGKDDDRSFARSVVLRDGHGAVLRLDRTAADLRPRGHNGWLRRSLVPNAAIRRPGCKPGGVGEFGAGQQDWGSVGSAELGQNDCTDRTGRPRGERQPYRRFVTRTAWPAPRTAARVADHSA